MPVVAVGQLASPEDLQHVRVLFKENDSRSGGTYSHRLYRQRAMSSGRELTPTAR